MNVKKNVTNRAAHSRELRIIGGTWRGRRLRFPPQEEIRPTPDRVRETLFNWLGPRVVGARCLDLFAGSGALGLEALSRGAAEVTFVERDGVAVRELRARLTEWGAVGGQVEHTDAVRFLGSTARPFEVVFLDPPFASGLLPRIATLLEAAALAQCKCADLCRNGRHRGPAGTARNMANNENQAGGGGGVSFVDARAE